MLLKYDSIDLVLYCTKQMNRNKNNINNYFISTSFILTIASIFLNRIVIPRTKSMLILYVCLIVTVITKCTISLGLS